MARPVTLNLLKGGESGVVSNVTCLNLPLYHRLLSMGITEGTAVRVSRVAPLGDPIEIEARGYKLSLRISEAQTVQVVR